MIIIDIHERGAYYTFTAHGDGSGTGDMKGPSQVHTDNSQKDKKIKNTSLPQVMSNKKHLRDKAMRSHYRDACVTEEEIV